MNSYVIATDSCSDLPQNIVEQFNLAIVPLLVTVEDFEFLHYLDERNYKTKDFYTLLRDKKVAKTSLINTETFINFFEPFLKEEKDIIYIAFSSALSGTYQSSVIARDMLLEKYPDRKIITIDSKGASMGLGLLVYLAATKNEANIEKLAKYVEDTKMSITHIFTVDDLGTLRRGGRLSDVSAILGTLLKIKPILHVSDEGKLVPLKKARGREFSLEKMLEVIFESFIEDKNETVFISHGDDLEDAQFVGNKIKEKYPKVKILYNDIGPVIGAHSGPGTIAVFFIGSKR